MRTGLRFVRKRYIALFRWIFAQAWLGKHVGYVLRSGTDDAECVAMETSAVTGPQP